MRRIVFSLFSCYIYFMTITQTVEIPASHRLTIDVPCEVPTGASVIIQFPVRDNTQQAAAPKGKLFKSKQELDEFLKNAHTPISDSLTGILSGIGDVDLDEIRMERLAKHLK
jgi:hypothetical protein